jgi:hypothetical protein
LTFLRKYPTFGTNRIYLLDSFTPTYYASVNPLVIEQSAAEIDAMDCTKFIRAELADKIAGAFPLYSAQVVTFSKDPLKYVYEGFTVTYVCMQLAYWMGFTTALLVGVDHRFTVEGQPNQEVVSQGDDPNHFAPDYFGKGVVWNNPDLARSEQAYRVAKLNFEHDGRKIVNLTPRSALDVFEREDWKNYAD